MIKTKNMVILAVVLVVLLGVNLLQQARHREATNRSATETVIEGEWTSDGLGRIVLGHGDDPEAVVLNNGPVGWIVETAWNAAANVDRVDALVRNLANLQGEYRSDNADVLADYCLDASTAVTIRGTDSSGQPAFALDVGSKPAGLPGNFIRRPGENAVYLSQTGILNLLGLYGDPEKPKSRFYLDLQAIQEERLDVDRFEIRDGDTVLECVKVFPESEPAADDSLASAGPDRTTWEWKLTGEPNLALAKSKVDAVFNSMVAVRATDVDDPGADLESYGLADPSRSFRLVMADGREVAARFGGQREADDDAQAGTWMKLDDDTTIWVVTDYAMKNIFKTKDDLKAE